MKREKLLEFLTYKLQPDLFKDYAPNGLQVAGSEKINKIITGVSANQALIDAAISHGADTLLVHHGFFWKGEDPRIIGVKRNRLKALLQHNINLIAYHLPLDAHDEFGNNVELARLLGIVLHGNASCGEKPSLTFYGDFEQQLTGDELAELIETKLGRKPLYISGGKNKIKKVAWCTGAAQDFIEPLALQGFDAYITGEISERTVALAHELGVHFYAAGHHATERYGIKALGERIAEEFGVSVSFIDIDNPV